MDTSGAQPSTQLFSLRLRAETPLAHLRARIRRALPGLARSVQGDIELVSTELASNAIEHADGPHLVRLVHHPDTHLIRIEVDDSSPDLMPKRNTSHPAQGCGLVIAAALSRWGIHLDPGRKTVWAEVSTI